MRKFLFVFVILVSFIFFSCKKGPRDFNSDLLGPDQINLVDLDSYVANLPQRSNSFKTVVKTGASTTLILGNFKTPAGNTQKASILLRFSYSALPDTNKNDLISGAATVTDSWIIFTKTYAIGDTNATQINFGAYKINTPWTAPGFTSDSLSNFSYNTDDLSLQKNFTTDSSNVYNVHLKGSAIQDQISNYANGVQDYGIYLEPDLSGNAVWGFGSFTSLYPPALAIVINKSGAYTDTLYLNTLASISILSGEDVTTTGDFYLQTSLVGQAEISFDVSIIPHGAIINQAKLLLTVDPSNTVNGTVFNSTIYSYNIADSASTIIDSTLSPISISQIDPNTFEGDITLFVQKWITIKNEGLLLTPLDGLKGLDLYAFKNSNASNAVQRPRLLIYYTKK